MKETIYSKIGWLGSLLLSFCSLPEVIKTIQTEQCSLSWGFLNMWGIGLILILIPLYREFKDKYVIFNYSVNLIFVMIMWYYKLGGINGI
jgi:uncharacterized protein with PQ loop repeat